MQTIDRDAMLEGMARIWQQSGGKLWVPLAMSAVAASCAANTTENTLATINLQPGIIGANGRLRITVLWTLTNSANGKTCAVKLGGSDFLATNYTVSASARTQIEIINRGVQNSQTSFAPNQTGFGASTGANLVGTVDTSLAQTLTITGTKAVAGEVLTLEAYLIELLSAS